MQRECKKDIKLLSSCLSLLCKSFPFTLINPLKQTTIVQSLSLQWLGTVALVTVFTTLLPSTSAQADDICEDPLAAVLATMECLMEKDVECTAAGYAPEGILKIHNGVDAFEGEIQDRSLGWWTAIMPVASYTLTYGNTSNAGPNVASIEYNETMVFTTGVELGAPASTEYPFGFVLEQSEHAFVTVNGACQIATWNQTGDDEEQNVETKAWADIVAEPVVACHFSPDTCANATTDSPGMTTTDDSGDSNESSSATTYDSIALSLFSKSFMLLSVVGLGFL